MDSMLSHPWTELQVLIKEKWLTQKAFASILWKKVSEVNELLKWKRNITIQRDYLLHQTLWTPIKYWILKQIDYDYSLLNIEESSLTTPQSLRDSSPNREQNSDDNFTPLWGGDSEGRGGWLQHHASHSEPNEMRRENPSNTTPMDFSFQSKWQEKLEDEIQVTPLDKEEKDEIWNNSKNDEDFKNRVKIFRNF